MKKLIPHSANVISLTNDKKIIYTCVYNYDKNSIKASFVGVKKYGFWIANAMCLN